MECKFSLKKSSLALTLVLPLLFLSDVLYGLMGHVGIELAFTPGILMRGSVFTMAIISMFWFRKHADNTLYIFIWLLILLSVPSLLVSLSFLESFGYDLLTLLKILYFPFVTIMLTIWLNRWHLKPDNLLTYIEYSAYCLGVTLLISQQLDLSHQTYGDYAYGNLGIFYAQNDMTLALGLALLAASYRLVNIRFSWIRLFMLLASGYACLQIGTRASLAIVLATATVPAICLFRGASSQKTSRNKTIVLHLLIGTTLLFTLGLFVADTLEKQREYTFQKEKLEELAQGTHPRSVLLEAGINHLKQRPDIYNLIGEGMTGFQTGVARKFDPSRRLRFVEVDWMDLYGAFGWPFSLALHGFLLWIILGSGWLFLVRGIQMYGVISAAGLLYLGHSILAGHALSSPIPSTLMAGYGAMFWATKRRNLEYMWFPATPIKTTPPSSRAIRDY